MVAQMFYSMNFSILVSLLFVLGFLTLNTRQFNNNNKNFKHHKAMTRKFVKVSF